jgi:hypothetical protein
MTTLSVFGLPSAKPGAPSAVTASNAASSRRKTVRGFCNGGCCPARDFRDGTKGIGDLPRFDHQVSNLRSCEV